MINLEIKISMKKNISRTAKRMKTSLPMRYININALQKILNKGDIYHIPQKNIGYITDISNTGLKLLLSKRPKKEDFFQLHISLPLKEITKRLTLNGLVKWSRPKFDSEYQKSRFSDYNYCCGIEFEVGSENKDLDIYLKYWKSLGFPEKN